MTDRYAVIGNPIAHSRSPQIHAMFARQTGQDLEYGRLLAASDAFAATVDEFRADGGRGLNVTLPFKTDAFAYADSLSERARAAGAVNTLRFDRNGAFGDNTDGVGLVRDIEQRLGLTLRGAQVVILGAGGAARGVVLPLLEAGAVSVLVANRTESRAHELLAALSALPQAAALANGRVAAGGWSALPPAADLIVNATAASLGGEAPPVPPALYRTARLAYDMVYANQPTAFMHAASAAGCPRVSDGLGMLVEQAAESFACWRGVRPLTGPVYAALR